VSALLKSNFYLKIYIRSSKRVVLTNLLFALIRKTLKCACEYPFASFLAQSEEKIDSSLSTFKTARKPCFQGWDTGAAISGGKSLQLVGDSWSLCECMNECLKRGAVGVSMPTKTTNEFGITFYSKTSCFCEMEMTGRTKDTDWHSRYIGLYQNDNTYPGTADGSSNHFLGQYEKVECVDLCLFEGYEGISYHSDTKNCYCNKEWLGYIPRAGWETTPIDGNFTMKELPDFV